MGYPERCTPSHQAQLRGRLCELPRIFLRPLDELLSLQLPLPLPVVPFLHVFHPHLHLPNPLNNFVPTWLLWHHTTAAGGLIGVLLLLLLFHF